MRGGPPQPIGDLFQTSEVLARARAVAGRQDVPALDGSSDPPEPKPNSPEDVGFLPVAPPAHESKLCSSCQRPILWAQLIDEYGDRVMNDDTGRPKSMPVDPDPVPHGNVRLFDRHGAIVARVLPKAELEAARAAHARLRVSHFSTCPNAPQHRRSRR